MAETLVARERSRDLHPGERSSLVTIKIEVIETQDVAMIAEVTTEAPIDQVAVINHDLGMIITNLNIRINVTHVEDMKLEDQTPTMVAKVAPRVVADLGQVVTGPIPAEADLDIVPNHMIDDPQGRYIELIAKGEVQGIDRNILVREIATIREADMDLVKAVVETLDIVVLTILIDTNPHLVLAIVDQGQAGIIPEVRPHKLLKRN